MANSTSDSLLRRLKASDHEAWERFATLYSPLIYAWCRQAGLQPHDASEISSDVTQSVFGAIQKFEPGRFRSWLRVVTKNRIHDFLKKKRAIAIGGTTFKGTLEQVQDPGLEPWDESAAVAKQETSFLYLRAVDLIQHEFSSQHCAIFRAYVMDGRDTEEVADQFGVSLDCIYQVKSRILKRLRDEFREIIE